MSTLAVAKKDARQAGRSKAVWGAAIALGLIAALIAFTSQASSAGPRETVRMVFKFVVLVLAVLLPIVALVASYLAIAGERESGGIKFLLALPNTRRDVFVGKLLSRTVVVAGGVLFMFVTAVSVALTQHGVFPATAILGTLGISLLYGLAFVSIAVGVSAAVGSRSRAIGGALTSYFALVILYVFPVVSVKGMVRWLHHGMLGMAKNPDLYNAVEYTSPYMAFQKASNLVLPRGLHQRPFFSSARNLPENVDYPGELERAVELPLYLTDEFSFVVFAFWIVVPLLVGYVLFERSDLE